MTALEIWVAIGGLTLATLFTRTVPLVVGRGALPPLLEAALRYAPACALTAIIVPDLVIQNGAVALGIDNPRLLGGIAAIVICLLTRGVLSTIAGGMLVYWAASWIVG